MRPGCSTSPTLVAVWLLCAACIRADEKSASEHFAEAPNSSGAAGQLIVFAAANDDLIGCIDVDRLAQIVFPDCRRVDSQPRAFLIGVEHQYELGFGEGRVRIFIAIAESRAAATAVGTRALPAAVWKIERNADSTHVFSGRACNMFIRNVFVRIQMNKGWEKLSSSYSLRDPAARRLMDSVAESLRRALHDPQVVTIREFVSTPKLDIVDVSRALQNGKAVDGAYNVVPRWGQPGAHAHGDGLYELVMKSGARSPEAEVRFARTTGETGVFRFDVGPWEPVEKTRLVWWERERMRLHRQKYGLTDDERNEIIGKLRKEEGPLDEQQRMVTRLKTEGAKESVPFFFEILHSNRISSIKNAVLYGLSGAIGREGLDLYRGFAADRMQPVGVRIVSVRLIGRHGGRDDIRILRQIADADGIKLPPLYPPEDQIRQLEIQRFDGKDVLLYEMWMALRLLEGKSLNP